MLSYITVGAKDIARSEAFYASVLVPVGPGRIGGPGAVYVKKSFDGHEATAGNGCMTVYQAQAQKVVRTRHEAGLAAGGSDEGPPGFRDEYSDRFCVGYLRDPLGNKLAIFSANPAEPCRRQLGDRRTERTKVFWFFFSKKNPFLLLPCAPPSASL